MTNSELADQIPPLKPPHGEIPPGFWEQYGVWIVVGSLVLIYLVTWLIWLLRRKRASRDTPPEVEAREAMVKLRPQPEDGNTLIQASQIVKRYFARAFNLPPGEHTTAEITRLAHESPAIGPELAQKLGLYLAELDNRKFAETSPAGGQAAVEKAMELINIAEGRREALRQQEKEAAKKEHAR